MLVELKVKNFAIIENLSLTFGKGLNILSGETGTGKSVLLKTLVGLLRADAGRVCINNQDVTNFTEEEYLPVRRRCGMVFQHPALFDSFLVSLLLILFLKNHLTRRTTSVLKRVLSRNRSQPEFSASSSNNDSYAILHSSTEMK